MDEFITGVDTYMASGLLFYYYLSVILSGFLLLFKYRFKAKASFVILLFWEGLFVYIGNSFSPIIYEVYKISIVFYAILLYRKDFLSNLTTKFRFINALFFVYTLIILLSMIINNQPIITSLSQYGKKYLLLFFIFHGVFSVRGNNSLNDYYKRVLLSIIITQIILSVFKVFILGFGESIVGSVSFIGGGLATSLPILGFLFIWQRTDGKIYAKDWLILFGLLLIAVASNKRAPVFVLPLITVAMYSYVFRTRKVFSFIKYIPFVLIILYVGIRSNPSLNVEGSRWGSFDIKYSTSYATDYMFGSERQLEADEDIVYGRGGSLKLLFAKAIYLLPINEVLFGQGVTETLKNYENFDNEKYGVVSKGALNGAMLKYISYGALGLLIHMIFGISLIRFYGESRFSIMLLIVFLGDFLLYNGVIFENAAMAFVMIILVRTLKKELI